nr:MAG TPA: hypothetical protein [Caudoviricetes sp.]
MNLRPPTPHETDFNLSNTLIININNTFACNYTQC